MVQNILNLNFRFNGKLVVQPMCIYIKEERLWRGKREYVFVCMCIFTHARVCMYACVCKICCIYDVCLCM